MDWMLGNANFREDRRGRDFQKVAYIPGVNDVRAGLFGGADDEGVVNVIFGQAILCQPFDGREVLFVRQRNYGEELTDLLNEE